MWCVIPVAGRATRLASQSDGRPKALLPLGDRPLIEHLLIRLGPRVTDACLVCSPDHREAFEALLGRERGGVRLHYAVQPRPLGVADAVGRAAGSARGPLLVVMGDCYFDTSLAGFAERWYEAATDGAVLVERPDAAGGQSMGLVEVAHGRVERIFKSPWTGQTDWRVCGAYLFPRSFFDVVADIAPADSGEIELEDAVTRLILGGAGFAAVPYGGWRRNINTPADLEAVRRRLARE